MPKLHRHPRSHHVAAAPPPADPVDEVLVDDVEADVEPEVEPIVVDEHGDDAAAVEVLVGEHGPELDVPARRRRRSS